LSSVGRYCFAWQRLVEACQLPPAFSQSAWVVIVDSDAPPGDGLAEGDEPEEEPDDVEPVLEPDPLAPVLPVPPVLPGAPLEPAAPLLPLPVAPPVCAAASAGAKQIIPIKTRESIFFIRLPPSMVREVSLPARGVSNNRTLDRRLTSASGAL
jgi:hypothetical protein